jgi:hypothetical protein
VQQKRYIARNLTGNTSHPIFWSFDSYKSVPVLLEIGVLGSEYKWSMSSLSSKKVLPFPFLLLERLLPHSDTLYECNSWWETSKEVPIVHIVGWWYARPLAKDPVQAMLLICLQEQMEGNRLVSKANRTFVAHMGIWPDSAGQGERLKQCAA